MQETASTYHIIRGILLLLLIIVVIGWFLIRTLKRSDDPPRLLFKLILTALVVGAMMWIVKPWSEKPLDIVDVNTGLLGGLILAVMWRHNIGAMFAKPFASLYDGGDVEIERRPYYSIAEAKRKRGLYAEAVAEIRRQLVRFPTDFQGQMMLAETQAENLNDLPGAELTIHRLCEQPDHAPRNIAFALNSIADWHLKFGQDRDAAQRALEKVVELYPGKELGILASQRIAHLTTTERLLEPHDRKPIHVSEGIKNIGLLQSSAHLAPGAGNPAELAAKYVKHLEQFPLDAEAREKLAIIYADHYERLDLAADQLEQLIELPNQPVKSVARWLNLLVDLQVKHGGDYDAARQTLERIMELFPTLPAADLARNRIDLLKLELKAKGKSEAVKLGTYEQNIGLKQGLPRQL